METSENYSARHTSYRTASLIDISDSEYRIGRATMRSTLSLKGAPMGTDLKTYTSPETGLRIICFSAAHTRDLFKRLGYDYRQYDSENLKEVNKVFLVAVNAQLKGLDSADRPLLTEDLELLARITGRD